jgi:integrase/recombinase XerC
MQEVFDRYIDYLEVERNVSPYTVRNYTTDLLGFFQFIKDSGSDSLRGVDTI